MSDSTCRRLPPAACRLRDTDAAAARITSARLPPATLRCRRFNISLAEEREIALQRLRVLCQSGNFRIEDFRSNPYRIFAAHEVAAFADPSVATKMTVQFNLVGGRQWWGPSLCGCRCRSVHPVRNPTLLLGPVH